MTHHGMTRMQEILSDYYGIEDRKDENLVFDINSHCFHAKNYVHNLLKSTGLNGLLQKDDQLIKEIKDLDNNMQLLIYQNYNKFISATDTIRKMKTNVGNMENDVLKVVEKMDKIALKSEQINTALAPHRIQTEKLITVSRSLKRLEFLFNLPQRLDLHIQNGDYANAIQYFLVARRILGRYEHITSFKAIQNDADKKMTHLKLELEATLQNDAYSPEKICSSISYLHALNSCSPLHRQQFLEWHQKYFMTQFDKLQSMENGVSVLKMMQKMNEIILYAFKNCVKEYKLAFLHAEGSNSPRKTDKYTQDEAFNQFGRDIICLYTQAIQRLFKTSADAFGSKNDVSSEDLSELKGILMEYPESEPYLMLMYTLKSFSDEMKQLDIIWMPLNAQNSANSVIETCLCFQMDLILQNLLRKMIQIVAKAHQIAMEDIGRVIIIPKAAILLSKELTTTVQMVLRELEPLIQSSALTLKEQAPDISCCVQMRFYGCFQWFQTQISLYIDKTHPIGLFFSDFNLPKSLECSSAFLLLLSSICREFSQHGSQECIRELIECLPIPPNTAKLHRKQTMDVTNIISMTLEMSENLSQFTAKRYGIELCHLIHSQMVQSGFKYAEHLQSEPRSISDSVAQMIIQMTRIARNIANMNGETHAFFTFRSDGSFQALERHNSQPLRSLNPTQCLEMQNIERFFQNSVAVFTNWSKPMRMSDYIMEFALKMVIKAWNEWMKCAFLTEFALQQVHLDAEFVRNTSALLLTDMERIETLLSQLISTARSCAEEDKLMDFNTILAIVSSESAIVLSRAKE